MSIILNIDTAVQTSSVCLSRDKEILSLRINPSQKDGASWLHVAASEILKENGVEIGQIGAIAVSAGPGSYTGLRVGMAAAKGLCFVLKLPLIAINTLQQMAFAAREEIKDCLLCPMIDARRMEVFTAIFDQQLNGVMPYRNMILEPSFFDEYLAGQTLCFFGNGSEKFKPLMQNKNAVFKEIASTAEHMRILSFNKLKEGDFADLAYSEPFYGKDFHSIVK